MKVAVLGGGVTGLAAAWRLARAGHEVRLLEAAPRLGGSVRTESAEGWLVESGPNSFQETSPEIGALISELGLDAERLLPSPEAKNRYVAAKGKLVALPSPASPAEFMASSLLSLRTKLRVVGEATQQPRERAEDASVADFARGHFGAEAVARVVQPLISGIYAGDPERLSARHAFPRIWEAERKTGSLVRAAKAAGQERRDQGLPSAPPILSFRRGLQTLTDALAAQLPRGSVSLKADARSIGPGTAARWRVAWTTGVEAFTGDFDFVIAALPAWGLARLAIGAGGATPLARLSGIEYPPVACVFLGYRREQVRHPLDGFGALVPATEGRSILGAIFTSSLFAGRAPAGHVALTVLAGGALQPEIAGLPKAELLRRVGADLADLVGAEGDPVFSRQAVWPRAIPQYNLGYGEHLALMARCEREHPGVLIGGSVRDGISLPDCLLSGVSLSKRVS